MRPRSTKRPASGKLRLPGRLFGRDSKERSGRLRLPGRLFGRENRPLLLSGLNSEVVPRAGPCSGVPIRPTSGRLRLSGRLGGESKGRLPSGRLRLPGRQSS